METQLRTRKPYPTDVSDEEWAFVAPYLTPDDAGRAAAAPRPARGLQRAALARAHRRPVALSAARPAAVAGGLPADPALARRRLSSRRWCTTCARCCAGQAGRSAQPTAAIFDSRTLQSTPESGHRAGYDGDKRRKGSKMHLAVDTLGHLLALRVTAGRRPGPGAGRRRWPPRCRRRPGRRSSWPSSIRATPATTAADAADARHPAGGGQAAGGQARLRAAAPALGGGALLRLGGALPPPGQRLRTLARNGRWACISSPLSASCCIDSLPSSPKVHNRL